MVDLRFDGSVWCNTEIALRAASALYEDETEALGLTVLEWYVLQSLYEQDNQMASQLAKNVGRQSTSFTPVLDKLEIKGFIERKQNPRDRRSVKICLTKEGKSIQELLEASVQRVESQLRERFTDKEWKAYEQAVAVLQTLEAV